MKSNILKFEVLKEEITPENVLEMSEVIVFAQTRFLIGYIGTRMQKIYAEVYADIKHKKDMRRVLSDGYDLVQEGALYLCEHYGRHLNDVIGYTKKGKAVTIRINPRWYSRPLGRFLKPPLLWGIFTFLPVEQARMSKSGRMGFFEL